MELRVLLLWHLGKGVWGRAQHQVNKWTINQQNYFLSEISFVVNLAVTLAQMGQSVGLLDADVFGKLILNEVLKYALTLNLCQVHPCL